MPGRDLRRSVSKLTLAAEGALWALAFFCPLALGGSPPWTLWPLSLLSGTAAVTAALGSWRDRRSLVLPAFTAALALGAALCLVQLVPWPRPLLDWLSPRSAQLRDFALIPLGLPAARPISLDPPATWRELAKALSYLLTFLAGVQVARSRSGARRRLAAAISLSGVAVALIGYGHQLADARSLFGMHAYAVAPPFLTTFGNPNHLSSLLTLTSTVSLGLALTAADRQRSALWALAYAVSGAAVFFSLSRGGICFFIASQLIFTFLLFRQRKSRHAAPSAGQRLPGRESWVILGVFAVLSISAFVASERVIAELRTADSVDKLRESKIQMWPMLVEGAKRFSRGGMGRGAFEAALSRYQTAWPEVTLTHPENLALQLWAELGLLGAALMGLTAAWAFLRLLRQPEPSALQLAMLSGLAGMALHDLFDFSLELPGCAAAACIAIAAASRSDNTLLAGAERRMPRWSAPLAAALGALALAALIPGRSTLAGEEQELAARLARPGSPAAVASALLPAIDRHPADYLLYDLAGRAYSGSRLARPKDALAFANRALFLRPLDVDAHRIAARSLLQLGRRSQGFLEYRLAYEAGLDQAATLDEAVPVARDLEEAKLIVPQAPVPLAQVSERLGSSRGALAESLIAEALTALGAHPDAPELWLIAARYRAQRRDFDGALDAVAHAEKSWPTSHRPAMARAAILSQKGQKADALSVLEASFTRHPESLDLSFALAQMHIEAGNARRAREVLARASPLVSSPFWRSKWLWMEGESFESEGQYAGALQAYQAAARVMPTEPGNHYSVARALEALKRPGEAMDAIREGMKHESPAGLEHGRARLAELEESRRKLQALRDEKMLAQ